MEKKILPATMPEFPIVRRMTLGMNSPLVVPSIFARMTTEEMQKDFTDGWDPLFIGYTAAVFFPHKRGEDKFVDDASKKDERLAAPPEMRCERS